MLDKDRKTNEVKAHCKKGICGRITSKPKPEAAFVQSSYPAAAATMHNGCPFLSRALVQRSGERQVQVKPRFTEQAEIQRGRMMVRRQRERKVVWG